MEDATDPVTLQVCGWVQRGEQAHTAGTPEGAQTATRQAPFLN